jgi:uncharacterized membrane protein YkoI
MLHLTKTATVFPPATLFLDALANNPVQTENAKPGNSDWILTNPAANREIEGYASLTSVNRGNTISFFISTNGPYTIDIYRLGWYGGAGARKMTDTVQRTGTIQPTPAPTADGLFECNWTLSHTLSVPSDWVSGVYVAKLTQSSSGKQSYIIFVVRDDSRASDYLFQSSVTTFQAYNNWPGIANGGKSLYEHNSSGGRATKVSFNRPYAIEPGAGTTAHPGPASGVGAGEFFTVNNTPATDIIYSAAWECNMVRFLEREGFDVTYSTSIDTHANGQNLLLHKGFISVGHDEYWSLEMRNSVEAARDGGVGLGFFGANIAYWQIRLDPSINDNSKLYRTIVCYKYVNPDETGGPRDPFPITPVPIDPIGVGDAPGDPRAGDAPRGNKITVKWRDPLLNRPEDALVGVMTDLSLGIPADTNIIVADASHWVFSGTGLQNNDALPGLLGYEIDRRFGNAPDDTVTLAHSPTGPGFSDVTIYTAPSGAIVFATGSPQWNWGLDDHHAPTLRPSRLSAAAQQITRNVLNQMRQPVTSTSSAIFVEEDNTTQGNWKGVYGADGFNIIADAKTDPAYAQVSVSGESSFTWEASTAEVRGLQKATNGSTDHIAATWFSGTSFTTDINLTDGQEHRVAVYCLDWDGNNGRSQRLEVLDAATNAVLDTHDVNKFTSGRYLIWQLKGHVRIRVTHRGAAGSNAVISGLFFDPLTTTTATTTTTTTILNAASATFVEEDNTTQGNWKGIYGADGFNIVADATNDPAYAQVSVSGESSFTWQASTAEVRGLQKAASGSTDHIAATWFSGTSFTIDLNLTDGQEHHVAVYCLDWDGSNGRSQRLEVLDAATNAVLDRRDVNAFSSGRYLVWQLKGHVRIKVTHRGAPGSNAVVSGLFFGPPPLPSDASATFVEEDNTTQGNWKGVYGADGFNIIADATNDPAYAQVSVSGEAPFTWESSTADVRGLQKAASGSTDHIAATWFSETSFTIGIDLTDGQEHRVAVYCVDWDENDGRSQRLEVLDAATNAVLDRHDVNAFSSGRYLVWQLKGHVRIRVTHTGVPGSNAVVSGVFFN